MIFPLPKKTKEKLKQWLCRRWDVPYCPEEIPVALHRLIEKSAPLRVVDVGAHRGGFMKSISRICGVSSGILVEALPFKIEWLKRDFPSKEYTIFACAVADREGTIEFNLNPMSDTSSLLRLRQEMPELSALPEGHSEKIQVDCKKLDDLVARVGMDRVDLLKIDVQGAEAMAFAGARETLEKTTLILTEVSLKPLYDDSATFFDIYQLMTAAGFKLLDLNPEFRGPDGELLQCDALFQRK
jgi:FkbM family methyltransferase